MDQGFRRSCNLSQLLTDDGLTKDGRRTKTDHKSSPCHYVIGELKCVHEDIMAGVYGLDGYNSPRTRRPNKSKQPGLGQDGKKFADDKEP